MRANITNSNGYFFDHGSKGKKWYSQGDAVSGKVAEKAVADGCATEVEARAKTPVKEKPANKANASAPENK